MDAIFTLSWKTIITIIFGSLLLRLAGRKSLSQMTIAQTIVMLAVGTVLIEPLVGAELANTYIVVAVAVITLIVIEYAEIVLPPLKKLFTGEPVVIIQDGQINRNNLKHVRMTIQQLEMELRQASIATASEVKWATLEPNGQFGYILKDELAPVTKQEFQTLLDRLNLIEQHLTAVDGFVPLTLNRANIKQDEQIKQDNVFEKLIINEKK